MSRASDCLTGEGKQKFTFFDKAEAKRVQRMVNQRSAYKGDSQMHVYRCPSCHCYHLGHEGNPAA